MKKLSILLAIVLTLCTALSTLPLERATAQSPSTSSPPELYAGTSNPGHAWKYMGGTTWTRISPIYPPLGYAVLSLVEYNHELYAGVIANDMSTGQVWKYEEGDNWTLVGQWMDDQVASLAVYKSQLYAGTAWNGMRLYRYNGSPNDWTRVVNYTSWSGTRSLYVFENYLLMGDITWDRFGHWDGTTFSPDLHGGGSCIYDYDEYDDYMYAAAWYGRLWQSSDGVNWSIRLGYDYGLGNMWEIETFEEELFAAYNNGELRASSIPDRGRLVYTAPDGIISMATDCEYLYFGTGGEAGYYGQTSGIANIYRYDGTNTELISLWDQFGAGVQVLYSPEKIVLGYMWQDLNVLEGKRLTHVVEAFAWLDSRAEGYLDTDHLNKGTFVETAETRNMVPLVSIQQASGRNNQWYRVISDPDMRAQLISSILDLIEEADYKGVDIDLEGLLYRDVVSYREFVLALRQALDNDARTSWPRRLITVTMQGSYLDRYSISSLIHIADYIMLMGYDYNIGVTDLAAGANELPLGPWDTDPTQPRGITRLYSCVHTHLERIVQEEYPAQQVIYLLPFYARFGGPGEEIAWRDLNQTQREEVINGHMNDFYLETPLFKYSTHGRSGKEKIEIEMWWTDPKCIRAKVRAALFENNITLPDGSNGNIGGVGAWQIGQDASDSELTEALWDAAHGL